MASDSIVSGAPRDSATGELLPQDPRIPISEQSSTIGAETRTEQPRKSDELTPEQMAAQISAQQEPPPPPVEPNLNALPRDHGGWISPSAKENGTGVQKWSGDPEEEIMPGEDVLYWVRSEPPPPKGQWGWMVPLQAKILGRLSNGDYTGIRFRSIHGGVFAIKQTRPSKVPKLDMITARKKFPPKLCMIPPGE